MSDPAALSTLYSALIQAAATIFAIVAGLLSISTLRGPLWGQLYGEFLTVSRQFTDRLKQLSEQARQAAEARDEQDQSIEFQMDETAQQLFAAEQALGNRIQAHTLAISDYKIILRALLLFGFFGVIVP